MIYDVILSREDDKYIARAKEWPEVMVVENSRDAAIDQLKSQLLDYLWFTRTLEFLCDFTVLRYDAQVEASFQSLLPKKIRIGTQDLKIAAIALSKGVKDVEINSAGVKVIAESGDYFEADYVVDAGGFRSLLANKFDLRDNNLQTHSRAIFTHMVNVPCYHHTGTSQTEFDIPFPLSEGTLHHLFEGGWLWVIPFDNHPQGTNSLCSVGLMLDPRIHSIRKEITPEEEFYSFIAKFPSISSQLQPAKAVRSWTRTGRIQYSSKKIIGDRFCLLGHAAGFVDPLFSKGLYTSLTSVSVAANLLLEAKKTGDYSTAKFQPLEDVTLGFIKNNDRLIANAYRSFSYYPLWSLYSVLWLLGAYCELLKLTTMRANAVNREDYYRQLRSLKLVGGGFTEFESLQEQIYTILDNNDFGSKEDCDRAVRNIKSLYSQIEWMPDAFEQVLRAAQSRWYK